MWSDVVLTARKNGNFTDKWKDFNYILPIFQGMNLLGILLTLKIIFNINLIPLFRIDIFPSKMLNGALTGIAVFMLPFYLLNYFLIIRNDRYEAIISNYKSYNGKILFYYIVISILSFFVPIIIYNIFNI